MKKAVIMFIALALAVLALGVAAAEETPASRFCGRWQDPVYGRATLRITPDLDAYAYARQLRFDAVIRWGSSASSEGVWTMSTRYDAASDALVYTGGKLTYVTYAEGGGIASEAVQYDDAEGRFAWANGKLLWDDSREQRSVEFAFQPLAKQAPDAEALRERLFEATADWAPGTAGSSLKLAGLCAGLMGLADEYTLWDADVPALRRNLLDAWSGLDETTRRRFDENLPEVETLMDMAMGDYESVAGQFDDAGVPFMRYLAQDGECRMCWSALRYFVHGMGDEE